MASKWSLGTALKYSRNEKPFYKIKKIKGGTSEYYTDT